MSIFWEMYQQRDIAEAQAAASRAKGEIVNVREEVGRLEDKIDALALTCQAMWELLRDRTSLSEQQIEEKMQEIDLRDGKRDGKMRGAVESCPLCGRKISRRRERCIYCGAASTSKRHVFQQ